jgi:hypothetical protein
MKRYENNSYYSFEDNEYSTSYRDKGVLKINNNNIYDASSLYPNFTEILETCTDYSQKDFFRFLEELSEKIYKNSIRFVLIGAGGSVTNLLYWFREFQLFANRFMEKNKTYSTTYKHYFLFNRILCIFEDDDIELSNLIRIPFDYKSLFSKVEIDKICLNKGVLLSEAISKTTGYKQLDCIKSKLDIGRAKTIIRNDLYSKHMFIGAPDIETRQSFNEKKIPLYTILHGSDSKNKQIGFICKNPTQEDLLQIESYGKIDMKYYFYLQFLTAIEFIKYLHENIENIATYEGHKKIWEKTVGDNEE